MDYTILGSEVSEELLKKCEENFHSAVYIRKGKTNKTCDDAALLLANEKFALIGIFDGVGSEPFAQYASETVLRTVKFFVTQNFGKIDNEILLERAIEEANFVINKGATTSSVALVLRDGRYFFANVGDSHIYYVSVQGKVTRITKDEKEANGSSFITYINSRYIVNNSLGGLIKNINTGKGKLKTSDYLLIASDGILDNLFITVDGGVIIDSSGSTDLEEIIIGKEKADEIVKTITNKVKERMESNEKLEEGKILIPKEDDISIVVLKF